MPAAMIMDDAERIYFVCSYLAAADDASVSDVMARLQRVRLPGGAIDADTRARLDAQARSPGALELVQRALKDATPISRTELLGLAKDLADADGAGPRRQLQELVQTMRPDTD